jgi:hypothetical protein
MKIVKAFSLILVVTLTLSTFGAASAQPLQQDPDDATIRQVLLDTVDQLGWPMPPPGEKRVEFDTTARGGLLYTASKYRYIGQAYITDAYVQIWAFPDESTAAGGFIPDELTGTFHGYPDYTWHYHQPQPPKTHTYFDWLAGRFIFEVYPKNEEVAEALYANAVAHGLIPPGSDEDGDVTPPAETPEPTPTITPEPGGDIVLKASKDGYAGATQTVDNGDNFGSILITGKVTDQNTGAGIEGATVEIVSGANGASTATDADGSYALTAVVPTGQDSGEVNNVDFALPVQADLKVEVAASRTSLAADGISTAEITVRVTDPAGNPLPNREFTLEAGGDVGPGSVEPAQATTDADGLIHATYTAFKPDPQAGGRHEVTVYARDAATGVSGFTDLTVSQHQLVVVLQNEYIPPCSQCLFPSELNISLRDDQDRPIPDAPVIVRLDGGDGTLMTDPTSNDANRELALTTDGEGRATAYYKWQGTPDVKEAVQKVVVLEETTNAQEERTVNIHGLDLVIARVEEAGFKGVTGAQAFLKIYVKDLLHPDLSLERFKGNPSYPLGLRVVIRQYHSDGPAVSMPYEETIGWDQDGGGIYVKRYSTPYMPTIIPVNDGHTWYDIRVDAVDGNDAYLPDPFRGNNSTIVALKTGTPEGWLTIFLMNGILTPKNHIGVFIKCAASFWPPTATAIAIVDIFNEAYRIYKTTNRWDIYDLNRKLAVQQVEHLKDVGLFDKLLAKRLGIIDNIATCMYDLLSVAQGSARSSHCGLCALPPAQLQQEVSPEEANDVLDKAVHGMLSDLPEYRGVIVFNQNLSSASLVDGSGNAVDDPNMVSSQNNLAVYLVPLDPAYSLQIDTDQPFEIAVYEPGGDEATKRTYRHAVTAEGPLKATMDVSSGSDFALSLDRGADGTVDETLTAAETVLDVAPPTVSEVWPADGDTVSANRPTIAATYADNPGGSGVDGSSVRVLIDGVDWTVEATVGESSFSYTPGALADGTHEVTLVIADQEGNHLSETWSFTVQSGGMEALVAGVGIVTILLLGAGVLGGGVVVAAVVAIPLRKRREPALVGIAAQAAAIQKQVQAGFLYPSQVQPLTAFDRRGRQWSLDPLRRTWAVWNGVMWQPARKPVGGLSAGIVVALAVGILIVVGSCLALVALGLAPGLLLFLSW